MTIRTIEANSDSTKSRSGGGAIPMSEALTAFGVNCPYFEPISAY